MLAQRPDPPKTAAGPATIANHRISSPLDQLYHVLQALASQTACRRRADGAASLSTVRSLRGWTRPLSRVHRSLPLAVQTPDAGPDETPARLPKHVDGYGQLSGR